MICNDIPLGYTMKRITPLQFDNQYRYGTVLIQTR